MGTNAIAALLHVFLVRICHTVRNAKAVSTAKQTRYVMNVPLIVEVHYIAISSMDLVQKVVAMAGLETIVTSPVHMVALHASNITPAHVANAVQAYMETIAKKSAVGTVKQ